VVEVIFTRGSRDHTSRSATGGRKDIRSLADEPLRHEAAIGEPSGVNLLQVNANSCSNMVNEGTGEAKVINTPEIRWSTAGPSIEGVIETSRVSNNEV
jgi:hypothetical protein